MARRREISYCRYPNVSGGGVVGGGWGGGGSEGSPSKDVGESGRSEEGVGRFRSSAGQKEVRVRGRLLEDNTFTYWSPPAVAQ